MRITRISSSLHCVEILEIRFLDSRKLSDFDEKMYDVDEFADDVQTTNDSNDGEGTEPND